MIIGICGLQGSGKDTIGNILVEKYGFVQLSFAKILKDIISVLFGWDRNLIEGSTEESRKWREQVDKWWATRLSIPNLTPRYILQFFGTELFRNHFHPDIWVAAVERQLSIYPNVVITDCRFPNEISMLKSSGTKFIKVTRGELPEWYNNYVLDPNQIPENIHPSEYLWINNHFDFTTENNGTIEELSDTIQDYIKNTE
jgi:hypothetical protein